MFGRYAGWAVSAALQYIATTIGTSRPSSSLSRSSGAAAPTGLPRAASRRGDGLRRRRGSTRPTAPQELERSARDLPGAFGDRRREQLRARMERRMERSADTEPQDDRARTRSNAGSRALGSSWRRLLGLHSERLPVLAQLCPLKDPPPPPPPPPPPAPPPPPPPARPRRAAPARPPPPHPPAPPPRPP